MLGWPEPAPGRDGVRWKAQGGVQHKWDGRLSRRKREVVRVRPTLTSAAAAGYGSHLLLRRRVVSKASLAERV